MNKIQKVSSSILCLLLPFALAATNGAVAQEAPSQLNVVDRLGPFAVDVVDVDDSYSSNLSGLHYVPKHDGDAAVLWSVQNNPSRLDRLNWDGSHSITLIKQR